MAVISVTSPRPSDISRKISRVVSKKRKAEADRSAVDDSMFDKRSVRSRSTFMGSTTIMRLSKKRTFDNLSYFSDINKKQFDKLNRILDAHREKIDTQRYVFTDFMKRRSTPTSKTFN